MIRASILALVFASSASAFTTAPRATFTTVRFADAAVVVEETVEPPAPKYPTLNGWTADESKFCWGLPGSVSPLGNFDPLGLSKDLDLTEMKRFREAEVTHGRVGMLAVLGFLVSESFHPLFGGQIAGPAIRHLDQVRDVAPAFFEILGLTIGICELYRATTGWKSPTEVEKYFAGELRDTYYPGDIGFDPLGLKPTDAKEFESMQSKEINNGRLAMLAAMGMIVQEQVNEMGILANLGVN
mmetsp:Transcript_7186/g.13385  ORF Transcript_7186/g.13385 Transcript_7186/m.13385 type:complete len:241 (+) Transcript_7186:270-992(+)